jgi:predicted anti-sigma-YlaC factor YlaD
MDDHPVDDLPALLFGELSPDKATAVGDHLAGCDACRRELAEMATASAALRNVARRAPAGAVPGDAATLAALEAEMAADTPAGSPLAPVGAPAVATAAPRRRRLAVGLGAVALLALLALAIVIADIRGGAGTPVDLAPLAGSSGTGSARIADEGRTEVVVVDTSGLAQHSGSFYEVWLMDQASGRLIPLGLLAPDGRGRFSVPAGLADRYRTVDVSLEADDGNPAHSGRSVLRGNAA